MDQIPADQAENLRKASTERLRAMAARIGTVDDDELANLDRMALIQVVAEDIVAKEIQTEELPADAGHRKLN